MGGDYEDDRDGSPPSSVENYQQDGAGALSDGGGRAGRPTHRHQNSFFGRFGRGRKQRRLQVGRRVLTNTRTFRVCRQVGRK